MRYQITIEIDDTLSRAATNIEVAEILRKLTNKCEHSCEISIGPLHNFDGRRIGEAKLVNEDIDP